MIVEIDDQKVTSIEELTEIIKDGGSEKSDYDVTIIRNNEKLHRNLQVIYENQEFSTGLYVLLSLVSLIACPKAPNVLLVGL